MRQPCLESTGVNLNHVSSLDFQLNMYYEWDTRRNLYFDFSQEDFLKSGYLSASPNIFPLAPICSQGGLKITCILFQNTVPVIITYSSNEWIDNAVYRLIIIQALKASVVDHRMEQLSVWCTVAHTNSIIQKTKTPLLYIEHKEDNVPRMARKYSFHLTPVNLIFQIDLAI